MNPNTFYKKEECSFCQRSDSEYRKYLDKHKKEHYTLLKDLTKSYKIHIEIYEKELLMHSVLVHDILYSHSNEIEQMLNNSNVNEKLNNLIKNIARYHMDYIEKISDNYVFTNHAEEFDVLAEKRSNQPIDIIGRTNTVNLSLLCWLVRYSELKCLSENACLFDYSQWILIATERCWPNNFRNNDIKPLILFQSIDNTNKELFHSCDTIEEIVNYLNSNKYLFSWGKVPGNDNGRLIEFLMQYFNIEWINAAKIEKNADGKTIMVTNDTNYLSLTLNNEKTNVNLEIDDGITDIFIVKTENGELNIYSNNTMPSDLCDKFTLDNYDCDNPQITKIDANRWTVILQNTEKNDYGRFLFKSDCEAIKIYKYIIKITPAFNKNNNDTEYQHFLLSSVFFDFKQLLKMKIYRENKSLMKIPITDVEIDWKNYGGNHSEISDKMYEICKSFRDTEYLNKIFSYHEVECPETYQDIIQDTILNVNGDYLLDYFGRRNKRGKKLLLSADCTCLELNNEASNISSILDNIIYRLFANCEDKEDNLYKSLYLYLAVYCNNFEYDFNWASRNMERNNNSRHDAARNQRLEDIS